MLTRQMVALGLSVVTALAVVSSLGHDAPAGTRDVTFRADPGNKEPLAGSVEAGTKPARSRRFRSRSGGTIPPIARLMKRHGWERLTKEKVDEVMAFTKKYLPEEYKRLEALRAEDPRQARRMLRRLHWLYERTQTYPPDVRGAAVARHRLNIAIFQTRREYLRTDDPAVRTRLTGELQGLLVRQFDSDQVVREYQIKCLARKLSELKAEIEQRKKDRKKIIAERLKSLLRPRPPHPPATGGPAADVNADRP